MDFVKSLVFFNFFRILPFRNAQPNMEEDEDSNREEETAVVGEGTA